MMRVKGGQKKIFYQFSLDERVPEEHFLRLLDKAVDFGFVRDMVRDCYSHTGAPSVDPVVVFKMSLLGYLYGITSERRLAQECRLNLAFMWFLGYDIDEIPPDHSILSKARRRFGPLKYEQFFARIVKMCAEKGLLGGEKVFLDATVVDANASLESLVSKPLHKALQDAKRYVKEVWEQNPNTDPTPDDTGNKPVDKLKSNERRVSQTDPDASIIARSNDRIPRLAYKVHVAADDGPSRIVTAVVATPGAVAEARVAPELVERHFWNTRNKPQEVVADRAYGTMGFYRYLEKLKILPTVPNRNPRKSLRKKKLGAGFTYNSAKDVYECPKGKTLYKMRSEKTTAGNQKYRVHRSACKGCELQGSLCKAKRPTIVHSEDNTLLVRVSSHLNTPRARRSQRRRKVQVEPLFSRIKGPMGFSRASLRGIWKVQIQALLAFTAHNLMQMVKYTMLAPAKIPAVQMKVAA